MSYEDRDRVTLAAAEDFLTFVSAADNKAAREVGLGKSLIALALKHPDKKAVMRVYRIKTKNLTEQAWRSTCDRALKEVKERVRRIDEWQAIKADVIQAFRSRKVEAHLRHSDGGLPEPAKPGSWETEYSRNMERLNDCRMGLENPFSPPGNDLRYIYVDQKSLIAAATQASSVPVSPAPKCEGATDYMEVILDIWHTRFKRAADQHTAKEVQDVIREAFEPRDWVEQALDNGKDPPSRDFINSVARVLRGHEKSKGGRQGRSQAPQS